MKARVLSVVGRVIIRTGYLFCFCTAVATRVRKKKHNWDPFISKVIALL